MQINTNTYALNTTRRMSANTNSLQQSLQRLSSGLRINGAKDDAAGMAIADRMTTQLRGNAQAMRNVQDGTSLLQTAEGALSTINDSLQRVRELTIQAANATNSSSDRQALQAEVNQILSEVDRISNTASFNGRLIFSQVENSISGDADQRAVMDGMMLGWLENSENRISKFYGISGDGAKLDIQLSDFTDGAGGTAARVVGSFAGYSGKGGDLKLQVDMTDFTPPDLPDGGTAPFYNDRVILHEMVHAVMYRSMNMGSLFNPTDSLSSRWFAEGMAEFIHGADERLNTDIAATNAQSAALTGTGGTATRDLSVAGASHFALEYKGSDFNIDLTGETFSGTGGNAATQAEIVVALQNKIDANATLRGKITVAAAAGNNLTLTTTDTGLDISLEIKQTGTSTGHTVLFGGAIAQTNGSGGAQAIINNIADGAGTKTWSLDSAHYSSGYTAVRYLHQKLKDAGATGGIKDFMTYLNENQGQIGLDSAFSHFLGTSESAFLVDFRNNGANFVRIQMNLTNTDTGAVGGLDTDGGVSYSATSIVTMNGTRIGENALTGFKASFEKIGSGVSGYNNLEFQVGYQAYQTINTQVGAINNKALGMEYIDIANAPSAALLRVDDALTYVRSMRGEIGAQLSRFEAASRSLQSANVDISAARSRTMDADYAQETAGLVRNQILQQSATAMLIQAKAVPQIALQLLRR